MDKIIWIDLDNSPHVPVFVPIIKEIESRNCKVIITARDFAQTVGLLKKTNLEFYVVGKHYGKSKLNKIVGMLIRAYQLFRIIRKFKIHAAMNHGSRSQIITCWFLNIPVFCGLDYEHTESFIFSRLGTKLWIPEGISLSGIKEIGATEKKVIKYKGYKEELYLKEFSEDSTFRTKHNIKEDQILVALRPPATEANYHDKQSEIFLPELIKFLKSKENVYIICLPRNNSQKQILSKFVSDNFFIPIDIIDGMNLAFHSDLVISGGGTMNREAALLGSPVYSIFTGKLGSLDSFMEKLGIIKFIHTIDDINKIEVKKKSMINKRAINQDLAKFLVDEVLSL